MENNKRNTGTYTFYKRENLKGRPSIYVRGFLNKIKTIEKEYPELFYEVLDMQGVCKNVNELDVLYKILSKKVRSYNKIKAKFIHCRFSENEISFFKNELEKQVQSKEWRKENTFNSFISKIVNTIIEEEKQVFDLRVFEDEKPSDKKKYDSLIPLKVYESPNIENPSLKKKLGASTPININESNFDWIESTSKITSLTRSDLIRKCLYSYRIKREINELIHNNNQILYQDKSINKYRLFFKPFQFSGTPNDKTFELLEKIKELEKDNYELVCDTINKYGICRNYLDLLAFEYYISYLIRREYKKNKDNSMFEPICLTKRGIPILLEFIFDVIEKEKNIIEIDEVIQPLRGSGYKSTPLVSVRLSNVYNFYTLLIREINSKYNSKNKVEEEEILEVKEEILEVKEVKEIIEVNKECLNCGEKLTNKKPVKKFCNKDCYFEFRKKSSESSILISEEQIVEELQTEELDTQKSDFNPFEKPVTKRDYNLNNESTPSIENFNLHNKIDFLKDETILSIADYLNQKNECLYQKIENSIKKEFYFVESMFKIRADELKNIQSNIELKTNKLNSDLIVFEKSTKEIEKSINQIKILSFLNVIVLILIIFFLLIDK